MTRWLALAGVLAVLLFAVHFTSVNGHQLVFLRLGPFSFYRVPISFIAFGGLFLGMGIMLLAGLHADLKVRELLRDRLMEETREERELIDRRQGDLFGTDPGDDR